MGEVEDMDAFDMVYSSVFRLCVSEFSDVEVLVVAWFVMDALASQGCLSWTCTGFYTFTPSFFEKYGSVDDSRFFGLVREVVGYVSQGDN